MTVFRFGKRSEQRLVGVHPDLVRVTRHALTISTVDITVLEGVRTKERQLKLVEAGASKTMNSRHIPRVPLLSSGVTAYAHAVDLGAWLDGELRWDWPLYHQIANAMKRAAQDEKVPLEWGGDWVDPRDGPHWQLPWKSYP